MKMRCGVAIACLGLSTCFAVASTAAALGAFSLPGCDAGCGSDVVGRWHLSAEWKAAIGSMGAVWSGCLLAQWILRGGMLSPRVAWLAAGGAIVSAAMLGVMVLQRYWCGYCFAFHISYLSFVAIGDWPSRP